MAGLGLSEAQIREMLGDEYREPPPDEFEVYAENWDAVMLFLRLQTQWIVGGMGGAIGLNYQSMESVMRMTKTRDRAAMFDRVRVMEGAALEEMNHGDS